MSKTYEDGLNDAWEAVKKLMSIGITLKERAEIFGNASTATIIEEYTAAEAIAKITEYENRIEVATRLLILQERKAL